MSFKLFLGMLLIGHLVGDFYLQSNKMADRKSGSKKILVEHCSVYALSGALFVALLGVSSCAVLFVFVLLLVSHLLIDGLVKKRALCVFEVRFQEKANLALFLFDQFLHIVIFLFACIVLAYTEPPFAWRFGLETSWLLALLISLKPARVFITSLLTAYRTHHVNDLGGESDKIRGSGAAIGFMERLIVVALALLGEYSAIAFVFTAKSIARFKEIESNKGFAEVYLLGTLASVGVAIFAALLSRWLFV